MNQSKPANNNRLNDLAIGAALFLLTAAFVLWQNTRVAVLWDLSYLLDTSWRIALGQVPYREFPLVHPPLTFLIQALLMRVFGRHYLIQILYAALSGGAGSVLCWRILHRILGQESPHVRWNAFLLVAPLILLGIYSIYPHPIYDCDCALAILFAIVLLQRFAASQTLTAAVAAGVAVVLPVFFKQNMGLPFLMVVIAGLLLLWTLNLRSLERRQLNRPLIRLLGTIAVTGMTAVLLLHFTVGLGNYLHWTIQFAAQRRLPGLADMLAIYRQPSLLWSLPALAAGLLLLVSKWGKNLWAQILASLLLAAPFLAVVSFLFMNDDADERADSLLALWPHLLIVAALLPLFELRKGVSLPRLLPFFVLAAIHGTFMSQQLWGSTYAIWPLLMLLVAQMLAMIPQSHAKLAPALALLASVTLLVSGGSYAVSLERLNYLHIPVDEPMTRATLPALQGMASRGPSIANFEELTAFVTRQIPADEGLLLLPGEDPFYFATGRTPQFPVLLFDPATDPYSPAALLAEARRRGIRWVIVKTQLQSTDNPLPQPAEVMELVDKEFRLCQKLAGYDVYQRR